MLNARDKFHGSLKGHTNEDISMDGLPRIEILAENDFRNGTSRNGDDLTASLSQDDYSTKGSRKV